jgi:hypothetical protein
MFSFDESRRWGAVAVEHLRFGSTTTVEKRRFCSTTVEKRRFCSTVEKRRIFGTRLALTYVISYFIVNRYRKMNPFICIRRGNSKFASTYVITYH